MSPNSTNHVDLTKERQALEERHTILVNVSDGNQLALHQLGKAGGPAVLCLHDLFSNSHQFSTPENKGLAEYLVQEGYQVFSLDQLGHGESWPHLRSDMIDSLYHRTGEYLSAVMNHVEQVTQGRLIVVAQGWGGIEWLGYIARHPERVSQVAAHVFLGTRLNWQAGSESDARTINWIWKKALPKIGQWQGLVPGSPFRLGEEKELPRYFNEVLQLSESDQWLDVYDGFDYQQALQRIELPPSLFINSAIDTSVGHQDDMRDFMHRLPKHDARLIKLGKKYGSKVNYKRSQLGNHPKAPEDYYPVLNEWLSDVMHQSDVSQAS